MTKLIFDNTPFLSYKGQFTKIAVSLLSTISLVATLLISSTPARADGWTLVDVIHDSTITSPPDKGSTVTISDARPDVRAHSEIIDSSGGATNAWVSCAYSLHYVYTGASQHTDLIVDGVFSANGNISYGLNDSPDPNSNIEATIPSGTSDESAQSNAGLNAKLVNQSDDIIPAPFVTGSTNKGVNDNYPLASDSKNPITIYHDVIARGFIFRPQPGEVFRSSSVYAETSVTVAKGNTGMATAQGYVSLITVTSH